jgi:hypothetical protein
LYRQYVSANPALDKNGISWAKKWLARRCASREGGSTRERERDKHQLQ